MAPSKKKRGASVKKPVTKTKPTKKSVRKSAKPAKAPAIAAAAALPSFPTAPPTEAKPAETPAAPPQTGDITIRVTVRKFLFAAKNVTVQLLKENAEVGSCSTDSSGLAGFSAPPGKYVVVCGSKSKEIDAQKNCDVTLRI